VIRKLHPDELHISIPRVEELVTTQFPQWAGLPLRVMAVQGTDNVMIELGDEKIIRLPRTERAATSLLKEWEWLSLLAPRLPLPIPRPIVLGHPVEDYPLPWLVMQKLAGSSPKDAEGLELSKAAEDLGRFVVALQGLDFRGGPKSSRAEPLRARDQETRRGIAAMGQLYDGQQLTAEWEAALATPEWDGPSTWIHGDLHAGNLLALGGRVSAVVDFGLMGVGDPAADLMAAWTLFEGESRSIFRSTIRPDDATWRRGRGWALTLGVVAYPYYRTHNPFLAAIAKRTLDELLSGT